MPIEVLIEATGQTAEFPDGTSPEVIKSALARYAQPQAVSEGVEPTTETLNQRYGLDVFGAPEQAGAAGQFVDQGMAFGWGDEITAGGAALAAKLQSMVDGGQISMADAYDEYHRALSQQNQTYSEENPIKSGVAEFGGAVATGGLGAAKLLSKVPQTAGRLAKYGATAGVGATEGAVYGAGTAAPGSRAKGAVVGAGIGAVAAPVFQGAANTVANRLAQRSERKLITESAPTREQLRGQASRLYSEIDDLGVTLTQEGFEGLTTKLNTKAADSGFHAKLHPRAAAALDEFTGIQGKVKLTDVEKLRRVLQSAGRSIEPDEQRISRILLDELDDAVATMKRSDVAQGDNKLAARKYKQARTLWSQNRKAELIETAMEKAKNQASGYENGLRTQFRALLNNKKINRLFSEQERKAMQRVVRGGKTENAMRLLSKFSFGNRNASNVVGGSLGAGIGASVGGAPGAVLVPLTAQAARSTAERMTRNNAKFAEALVRAGKDGREVAKAYFRQPGKKDPEELAALILNNNVDGFSNLSRISPETPRGKLLRDAISLATAQRTANGEAVNDRALIQGLQGVKLTSRVPNDAPHINLTKTAISDAPNLKSMRQRALGYAKKHIAGSHYTNVDTGMEIGVPLSGVKHTLHNAKEDLIASVADIPEILKNGKLIETKPHSKNKNIDAVHYFGVKLNINGKIKDVVAVINEDKSGKRYYDHSFEKE